MPNFDAKGNERVTIYDASNHALVVNADGSLNVTAAGGGEAVNIAQVGGAAVALGQTTKSASLPITLASDQGNLPTITNDVSTTGAVTNDGDVVSLALPGGQATALVNILMGTLVGTLLFEASPDSGTTWVSVMGALAGASTLGTSTTATGVWRVGVSGFTNFRVRLHPTVSGTSGTISVRVSQGAHNVAVTNVSALGQAVMANSSPVVIASDQSAVPIKPGWVEASGLSVSALNNDLYAATDVSAYRWAVLQITAAGVGTLQIQFSNDNSTWVAWPAQTATISASNVSTSVTAAGLFALPIMGRYMRVHCTAYTSGTFTGVVELWSQPAAPYALNVVSATQSATWTVQPGNTPNTTAWLTQQTPATSGGTSVARFDSAASTNAMSTKASAGQLYGGHIGNNGASDAWVKFYNKASSPTVGTDTPFLVVYVPKGAAVPIPISANGIPLGTGIAYAITGGAGDADTTAVAAHQVTGWFEYK